MRRLVRVLAAGIVLAATSGAAQNVDAIRPFKVNIPQADLDDLRRRIAATRWPDKETVTALPQLITNIDGGDIHFIHVRSRHKNALPVIITHGWPGSVIEQLKIIGPLTDPTAHGGSAEDAFDVVIPSLPGYGFSGRPTVTGWNPERIARAWGELGNSPSSSRLSSAPPSSH